VEYIDHLSKDKRLHKIIKDQTPVKLIRRKDILGRLCISIMSQQLSTRVASVIQRRFLALYPSKPTAELILETPVENLRGIGLSQAKSPYIQNVARFCLEQGLDYQKIKKLSNQEVIEYLTQIKGVGLWTCEMLMMFTLGREDVFSAGDLGIRQAMSKLYGLDDSNFKKFKEQMDSISSSWSPFRTYACVHLWQWKDRGPEK
jgi:DNA-3-methyladenine glycosylase II